MGFSRIVVSCGMLYIPHNNDHHHANLIVGIVNHNLHILAFPGAVVHIKRSVYHVVIQGREMACQDATAE